MHVKMPARARVRSGVWVVGREGEVLDEMCAGGSGKGARFDFFAYVDLGARDGQSVASDQRVIVLAEGIE